LLASEGGRGPREEAVAGEDEDGIVSENPCANLTRVEVDREVDRRVDLASRADAGARLEQEGIADEIFRSLFANQTGLVLCPTLRATRLYTELGARAEASLFREPKAGHLPPRVVPRSPGETARLW